MAALIMLYFAFTNPNVIARWTGADYGLILVLIVLTLIAFVFTRHRLMRLPRSAILIGNAAFVIALTATLFAHHLDFPLNPDYPLAEPLAPVWATVTFRVDLSAVPRHSAGYQPLQPRTDRAAAVSANAGRITLAGLFLLLMIFAQVFTTVYDYIPVIGPLFRDRFWLVFAALGVVMVLPLLLLRLPQPSSVERLSKDWLWVVPLFGALTLFYVAWTPRSPASVRINHTPCVC